MADLPVAIGYQRQRESMPQLGARAASLGVGAMAVFAGYALSSAWRAIASTNGWIVFFLVSKPLIDLTWRWEFGQFTEQRLNLQAIVGVCVIGFAAARLWHLRHQSSHLWPVVAMLVIATLSVLYSPSSWGANELIRLYSGIAFFFIAGQPLSKQPAFDRFAYAFVAVLTLPVVLALLQTAGMVPFDYWDWIEGLQIGRASGTYTTPLGLIYFLMYSIPLTLYLLERKHSWILRISLGASLVALACTLHRTAIVAIATQLLLWLALKKRLKMLLALVLMGTVGLVLYAGAFRALYAPLNDALHGDVDVEGDQFLRGRGLIWATFLADYAQGNPIHWLIGRGGSVLNGSLFLDEMGENDPHNDFVRLLHDYGLLGVLAYLAALARLCAIAWKLRNTTAFADGLARVFLVSLAAMMILSFTGEPMRYPAAVWYLFALASLLVTLRTMATGVDAKFTTACQS